ncbi:MAG: hypothetical protein KBD36_02295 [Alphaproteobacteria bacterium]|jgi:hypothetical protein|nr:hypothetical protein [Alphaproteobacteria bacterium]MBP9776660.1 hypothetical protein [Alphaproteobacteria bacterium]
MQYRALALLTIFSPGLSAVSVKEDSSSNHAKGYKDLETLKKVHVDGDVFGNYSTGEQPYEAY